MRHPQLQQVENLPLHRYLGVTEIRPSEGRADLEMLVNVGTCKARKTRRSAHRGNTLVGIGGLAKACGGSKHGDPLKAC